MVRRAAPTALIPPTAESEAIELEWGAHFNVGRTITETFREGWEDVIYELIKNAIDAKASELRISCPTVELPANHTVTFRDNGHGMTAAEVKEKFCMIGRPRRLFEAETRYGLRGTGRLSCFSVAEQMEVVTVKGSERTSFKLTRTFIRGQKQTPTRKFPGQRTTDTVSAHGTTITLSGLDQRHGIPTAETIGRGVLRRFGQPHLSVIINDAVYAPTNYATAAADLKDEFPEFGVVQGTLWMLKERDAKRLTNWPSGVIVNMNGQTYFGPDLFGADSVDRSAMWRRVTRGLLGHIDIAMGEEAPTPTTRWPQGEHFSLLRRWIADHIERVVRTHVNEQVSARVNALLGDSRLREIYNRCDDRKRAQVTSVLTKLVHEKASDQANVKIIARLVARCVEVASLEAVLDTIGAAHEQDINALHGMLTGADKWSIRRVVAASAMVKHRSDTLDRIDRMLTSIKTNEKDIHKVLAENPWIFADRFAMFRSNGQIQKTLKLIFGADGRESKAEDDTRRPDLFFILGDEDSTDYLFVELKGDAQALDKAAENQAKDTAAIFLSAVPGSRAHVILVGSEYKKKGAADTRGSGSNYEYESLLYGEMIRRARARLAYVRDATHDDEERLLDAALAVHSATLTDLIAAPEPPSPTPMLPGMS